MQRRCWCGGTAARPVDTFVVGEEHFTLVRCEDCGVCALHPQPSDAQLNTYYAPEYYGASRRKFIKPIAMLVSFLQGGRARFTARYVPAGGRVLDVGCGNGGFLMQLKAKGFQVEGTEWSAQSAARIPRESGITVHVGDLLSLDLPEHQCDLITLWHVFEHLRDPHATLQAIHRLLKPDGTLILSLPNVESWQAQRFGAAWFHHDPPRHLFAFGVRSLTRLLQQDGFAVTRVSTWSLEQNPYGFIQSWLNTRPRMFPRDQAYSTLKGLKTASGWSRLRDLTLVSMLTIPALLHSITEAFVGKGATMTIVSKRNA